MNDIKHVSDERLRRIEYDARGLKKNRPQEAFTASQIAAEVAREQRRRKA